MVDTRDVRQAFGHLSTVETENSDLAEGVRVAVDAAEAGQFFKTLRQNGFEAQTRRIGSTLVAHVRAEQEEGLGQLFG